MLEYKIDFNSITWESPAPGVRFKAYRYKNKMLRLVEYTSDFMERDWCLRGHTGFVVDGELEIDFSGTIIPYSKGDAIHIPAGDVHKHKARILTDTATVFLSEDI